MNKPEFSSVMKELITLFPDKPPNEVQVSYLWETFQDFDVQTVKRSIKVLFKNYKYKSFPTLQEMLSCINYVLDEQNPSFATADELNGDSFCQQCGNTGYFLYEKKYADVKDIEGALRPNTHTTARPCTCSFGRTRAEGLKVYFINLKYKKNLKDSAVLEEGL